MALQPEVESNTDAPQSMADTIAETWRGIQERSNDPPPVDAEKVEVEKPAKARDESGKFAKADPEPEKVEAQPEAEAPKKSFVPKWKKEALEKWATVDPAIQAEVERREQDFHKGIEQYKTDAQVAKEWDSTLAPYMPTIKSFGVSPQQAAAHLFNIENTLRSGLPQQKAAVIGQLCRDYQIPLQALIPAAQGQQPQLDPNLQMLHQQLSQLQGQMAQQQYAAQSAQEQELSAQIAKFQAGKEHFETLKPQMAELLRHGLAPDLESAYDQAFRTHPVTASIWLAEQQAKWQADAKEKAEAARKSASVNIKPRGSLSTAPKASGSMSETISAQARALGLI